MKSRWLPLAVFSWCVTSAFVAAPEPASIPSISGALTIDGKLDDPAWHSARILSLATPEVILPLPPGGEVRIATRGKYLCLSARIPESGGIVAHSTGPNPTWWSEDLITWTFRVHAAALGRNLNLSLAINPLGAWRFQNASTRELVEDTKRVLVAASLGHEEWTVEAAIPLESLSQMGFFDVQRVRAARPETPELHWYWPAPNEGAAYRLVAPTSEAAPEFQPTRRRSGSMLEQGSHPAVAELAWIPKNVWTEEHRNALHVERMLEKSLRDRLEVIAEQEKREWEKVGSRQAWERFRDTRLAALRKWIGPLPERTPLRPLVTRRINYDEGFVIENLVYESRPHLLVTANLYLPDKPSGKIPAIVVVHSHHAPKVQSELQDLGMTWSRSGTAVLIMDQLCAGERSQSQPWPRESYYGRYALGNQLYLAGESLMKWMVWDLMRGIDLLLEKAYIDPQRIIMLGAVAGGGDPAAVTAALDPRIAAVVPFNFGEAGPEEHYTEGPRGYSFETAWPGWGEWETTRNLAHSVVDQFFPWFLCASVAPRPFLYSFEIGWPEDVEHEPAWARYKKVFELYGARDHLDEVHGFGPFPGPGECTNVSTFLRRGIYPILKRWLDVPVPGSEYHHPQPESELMCLTPTVAAERRPKTASAIANEIARERLLLSRSRLSSLPGQRRLAELRDALKDKLGEIEPLAKPTVQTLWSRSVAQVSVEALTIETDAGITLPVLLLKPAHGAFKQSPAVLAMAEGGKEGFLFQRGEEIINLLRNGLAVCLPDLRGTGEVAATSSRGPAAMSLAATEFMLGESMLGAQLKDARTLFRYLASRPDINPARIALWGDSFAPTNADDFVFDQSDLQETGPFIQHQAEPMGGLLSLLTALYEERAVAVTARGGLVSFLSLLENRFCHVPQDVIVPGILEVADMSDIVEALHHRPVLIESSVDGRDKVARLTQLQTEFRMALKASPRLILREAGGDPRLASWISNQCLSQQE